MIKSLSMRPYQTLLALLAGFVLLCLTAGDSLLSLIQAWQSDEYSHGFLIPLLALLIGGHKLRMTKPDLAPSFWGVAVTFLGSLLIIAGKVATFEPMIFYGLITGMVGLCLGFMGVKASKTLLPAFIYLLFAIPLPRLIYVTLSQDLQLLSSTLGVDIIQALGFSVYQDGNIIDLGTSKLQVAEACNGLRYLFPLMSFGYLVALMMEDRFWKRAFVFLSTIPIAIGTNALRIAVVGVSVNLWGEQMAQGLLHDFEGWSLFAFCLFVLLIETVVLQRLGRHGKFRFDFLSLPTPPFTKGEKKVAAPALLTLIVCFIFAGAQTSGIFNKHDEIVPPHPAFATFPLRLGDWRGSVEIIDKEILSVLALDDYWMASYTKDDGKPPVNFYMAYYNSQRAGSSAHSPSNCLPGGGWHIARSETIDALTNEAPIKISRLLLEQEGKRQILYFWFDERGRILTEQYGAKFYLLIDALRLNRTDGGLVRMATAISPNESEQDAEARLQDFLRQVYPHIRAFIPGR